MHTGSSRTSVQRNHALITPESHVPLHLPGWEDAEVVVMISEEIGAKFRQLLVTASVSARAAMGAREMERLVFVLEGEARFTVGGSKVQMTAEDYAYLPAGAPVDGTLNAGCRLLVFEKRYVPVAGVALPEAFSRSLADVPGEAFLGDEGAILQVLLPDEAAHDWGINVFEFAPGGTLPQVESHFMEHGLLLLGGQGVYRLGESWYPVEAGDAIWMGPYEPQWYVAAGKTPSRYIYYKEMNRAPGS